MNKIFFENKIKKITNPGARNYFLDFFKLKKIILKLIFLFTIGIFVLLMSFGVRNYYLEIDTTNTVFNDGVAFSIGNNLSPSIIILIQFLPCIFCFLAIVFINNAWIYVPFIFSFYGGLSNLIDRFVQDYKIVNNTIEYYDCTVVDYLNAQSSIFNLPDMFVIGGVICVALTSFVFIFINADESKNKNKNIK